MVSQHIGTKILIKKAGRPAKIGTSGNAGCNIGLVYANCEILEASSFNKIASNYEQNVAVPQSLNFVLYMDIPTYMYMDKNNRMFNIYSLIFLCKYYI